MDAIARRMITGLLALYALFGWLGHRLGGWTAAAGAVACAVVATAIVLLFAAITSPRT
jgi:hypothetical protein